jgi:hypothetical protein
MRNTVGHFSFTASELEANPSFNVMIAYEDFESGKHAKRTYDVLAENVGRDYNCSSQMWKLEVVTVPVLREMAARDAAAAEIVLVSVRGTRDLLPELKSWLSLWLAAPGRTIALVALVDRS